MAGTMKPHTMFKDAIVSLEDNPSIDELETLGGFLERGGLEEWMKACDMEIAVTRFPVCVEGEDVPTGTECIHGVVRRGRGKDAKKVDFWYPTEWLQDDVIYLFEAVDGTSAAILMADDHNADEWLAMHYEQDEYEEAAHRLFGYEFY